MAFVRASETEISSVLPPTRRGRTFSSSRTMRSQIDARRRPDIKRIPADSSLSSVLAHTLAMCRLAQALKHQTHSRLSCSKLLLLPSLFRNIPCALLSSGKTNLFKFHMCTMERREPLCASRSLFRKAIHLKIILKRGRSLARRLPELLCCGENKKEKRREEE